MLIATCLWPHTTGCGLIVPFVEHHANSICATAYYQAPPIAEHSLWQQGFKLKFHQSARRSNIIRNPNKRASR
jgi:hypothetical protein